MRKLYNYGCNYGHEYNYTIIIPTTNKIDANKIVNIIKKNFSVSLPCINQTEAFSQISSSIILRIKCQLPEPKDVQQKIYNEIKELDYTNIIILSGSEQNFNVWEGSKLKTNNKNTKPNIPRLNIPKLNLTQRYNDVKKNILERYKNNTENKIVDNYKDKHELDKIKSKNYRTKRALEELRTSLDENYRRKLIHHIPQENLLEFINDSNNSIRIYVAEQVDKEYLPQLINDKSDDVRRVIARRIDEKYLTQMVDDKSIEVLEEIANRNHEESLLKLKDNSRNFYVMRSVVANIDKKYLPEILWKYKDEDERYNTFRLYNEILNRGINKNQLHLLIDHPDWGIRYKVVRNINKIHLPKLMNDPYIDIRFIAAKRLGFFILVLLILKTFLFIVFYPILKPLKSIKDHHLSKKPQLENKSLYLKEAEQEIEEFLSQNNVTNN